MSKTIDAARFKQIKAIIKSSGNRQTAANRAGVSLETIRRVNNAKTFLEYKANNTKAHPTPKPGTVITPTRSKSSNTTITPQAKKPTLWKRFLAFFDIV